MQIVEDVDEGKVSDREALLTRLEEDIGAFKSGSALRESFDRLISYVQQGDPRAQGEMDFLYDACMDVTDY